MQQNNPNFKPNVFPSLRSDQMVLRPTSSGSLLGCNRSNLPRGSILISDPSVPGSAVVQQLSNSESSNHELHLPIVQDTVQGLSTSSKNRASSSSGLPAASSGKGKTVVSRMSKLRKKYWCFMPF